MTDPTGLDRTDRNRQTLSDLKFAYIQAAEFLKKTGANFFYFLSPERREGRLEARARMFFYGGEDSATGSAAGCAASWMVQHGVANSDEQVVIQQGVGQAKCTFERGGKGNALPMSGSVAMPWKYCAEPWPCK